MNHLVEEHGNVNQDSGAYNTRNKKRAMEEMASQTPNQPSTLSAMPHVQVVNHQHNFNQPIDVSLQQSWDES